MAAKQAHLLVNQASGIYLMLFMAFLFIILIGAQRTAIAFMASLTNIVCTCLCFSLGLMLNNPRCLTVSSHFKKGRH